jgi:hypothetical protein
MVDPSLQDELGSPVRLGRQPDPVALLAEHAGVRRRLSGHLPG